MTTMVSSGPFGKYAVELRYEGEIRFGPFYFSCKPIAFQADFSGLPVGESIHWKDDSSSFVMLVFHSLRSDRPPETELVWVDTNSGEITSIEVCAEGLIHMGGFDETGEYSYEVRSEGRRRLKKVSW